MKRTPLRRPWQAPKPIKRIREIEPGLRQLVRDRSGGLCECCGDRLSAIFQAHHRKLKSRGGQDSASNLLATCGLCHRRIHSHVKWATENGFIVASTDDPAAVPVAAHCDDWRYLTWDGKYKAVPVGAA